MKYKGLFILHTEYHGCLFPGDARNQGVTSYSIDVIQPEYSGLRAEKD